MPAKYEDALQRILEAATTGSREDLVSRLQSIVSEHTDPMTPVLAMGAICYGRANTDSRLTAPEIGALRNFSELAQQRAAAAPGTPEGLMAQGAATLFTLVARQAAGEAIPAAEQRKAVAGARALAERAARGNNQPLFDVLLAATWRFFPAKLRDRKVKDEGANRLAQHGKVDGATGTLARLLFAEHLLRRGYGHKLGAVASQLARDLPNAACVMAFQGAAALSAGRPDTAEVHFAQAFQRNPQDTAIRKAYAQILRANGKTGQAEEIAGD